MPTYLYECQNCGRFEEFQKISEDPLEECPECGAPVKRIIGNPGVIFKGSGFYSTENKTDSSTTKKNGKSKKNEQTQEVNSSSSDEKAS